jgi:hypothetical protein
MNPRITDVVEPSAKVQRFMWEAEYETTEWEHEDDSELHPSRTQLIVTSSSGDQTVHFLQASRKACGNIKAGETLVSVSKRNDVVV